MPSDVFQWKDSSHTVSSLGVGAKLSLVNEDVNRDTTTTRDYLQQLLRDDMLEKLEQMTCCYNDHFTCEDGTSVTIEHREKLQELACKVTDRACEELLDKYVNDEQKIADAQRLELENRYCELDSQLNAVAGSTRNSFSQEVYARTLHENNFAVTGLLAQLRHDAITRETEAIQQAFDRKYLAFIEADEKDFQKYLASFQLLRGAWNKIDFVDDTDDVIDRDVRDFTVTGQWNRTAGSISSADGTYAGDQSAINAAAGALNLPTP